jgi:hypothetical protein
LVQVLKLDEDVLHGVAGFGRSMGSGKNNLSFFGIVASRYSFIT